MTTVYLITALIVAAIVFLLVLPKTSSLRLTGNIPASPEKIFAVITDLNKAAQWLPDCIEAVKTEGRDGAARKQRISFQGAIEEQQVTTWVDNRQYGWKLLHPQGPLADARTVLTLTKRGDETEVEILGEWTAASLFAKLPAKFAEPKRVRARYEGMLALLRKNAV